MPTLSRRALLAAGPAVLAAQTKPSKPNVIIVYVDELRATALRLYHPDGIETPNLARLANRGVLFTNAFTPHPLCLPARVSLWTGQYSRTHGSRDNLVWMKDDSQSMARVLRAGGYRTGIFGKNHCFTPSQLQRSFDVDASFPANIAAGDNALNRSLTPEAAAQVQRHFQWIRQTGGMPTAAPFPPEIFETHRITGRALDFIEQESGRGAPFAAWISILDPHAPMQAPEQYARMFPPDQIKLPPFHPGEMKTKNTRMQIYDYLLRGPELPESFLRQFLSIYYGMTAFVDHEIGRLMDLLEKKRLLENTIVVFSADHGDFAAEHHLFYKTGSLVDSMVRIPLLVSWPGHLPEKHREDALVNQVDIMPTLLDFCGLDVPRAVEGRRLPFLAGDSRRPFVYSEYGAGGPEFTWEHAHAQGQPKKLGLYGGGAGTEMAARAMRNRESAGHLRMIRTHTHKLVRDSNGDVEFCDLTKDPNEFENVHGRPEYRAAEQKLEKNLASDFL